ncbi:MAG: S-adenosylmethionine:tRNA ribosyltransferase-isomerase, partial [Myxococcales bacterium]|nr:S-adenosylmethionine:tRNA ribosyltransferase-isomerase [Myxococcales bacterium]
MTAALLPRSVFVQRLLVVDPASGRTVDAGFADLPSFLGPGDVLVVNDAATLPASLACRIRGLACELRLAGPDGWVVLFGPGSWRDRTEDRAAPPEVGVGEIVRVAGRDVRVEAVSDVSPRLVRLPLTLEEVLHHGVPVQYSYVPRPLELHEVQTPYAERPWAVEMPSAGRVLTPRLVASLRAAGVAVERLTHAAGLSATGDPALDAALPLPERYEVPEATWAAVQGARRVIAVGTSVVRAL